MISHIKESLAIFLLLIRSSVPHERFLVKWSVKLKLRTSWSPEYCVQINDMVIMFHHLLPSSNSPQGTSFSAAISREFDIDRDIIKDTNQTQHTPLTGLRYNHGDLG